MHALIVTLTLLVSVVSGGRAQTGDDGGAPATRTPAGPAAVPAYRQARQVAVLTVHEEISRHTLRSLERRVERALQDGANAIVLDIDTPGGELTATLDICHLLKTDAPANSVAWINPQAYSAGTIIALACREIVVAPNATFGDAAPIQAGPFGLAPLGPAERAKVESPILEEVVDSARRNHYDENLVQSFVSVGVELWLLENVKTGERIFVDPVEYEAVFGDEPPVRQTPVAPPAAAAPDQPPVRPWINQTAPPERRGDDAEKIEQFVRSLTPARPRLTASDRDEWRLVDQVIAADRLLTVKEQEAIFYGLARRTIASEAELAAYFGAASITRYDRSWSEVLVRFLTHPLVMGVLIILFVIGLVAELAAPGLGVFGATSLAALALLVGAPYLAGMAQWWDILLIVAGICLVAAELLLIPGMGVAGILGAVCLLAGLVGLFVTADIGSAEGQGQLATGLVTTLAGMFAAGIGVWLISRQVHSLPLLDRIILSTELSERGDVGVLAAMGTQASSGPAPGDLGVAATGLRPAGRGDFGGKLWDVKSVSGFIEAGSSIRVVSAGRFVIEVEEAEA